MAMAFESFSIREYATKMRGVDVGKSWPFKGGGEDTNKERMKDLLPPIVCRKYRWWSKELEEEKAKEVEKGSKPDTVSGLGLEKLRIDDPEEVLGDDENSTVKICPVCQTFSATTINAVNAHIDSCLAQASREEKRQMRAASKAKVKAPKKRSIVEIFAVAPQIERLDDDDDDDDDNDEEEEVVEDPKRRTQEESGLNFKSPSSDLASKLKRKKGKGKLKILKEKEMSEWKKKNRSDVKRKKNNTKLLTKNKKRIMLRKIKKMKKKGGTGIFAASKQLGAKKEKTQNSMKMPSELVCTQLLQGSSDNNTQGKEITDHAGMRKKKKSIIKNSPKKNQHHIFKASKVARIQEPPALPLHSILKNRNKVASIQKSSEAGNLQGENLVKNHQLQHSGKHVRFSGEVDILGRTEKWGSFELPPSGKELLVESCDCLPVIDEVQDVNESEKDVFLIVDDSEVQPLHEKKQRADVHGHFVPTVIGRCHDIGRISLEESVDLNQALQHSDDLHQFDSCSSVPPHNVSCIPKTINFPKGVAFDDGNQAERSEWGVLNMNMRMPDPFEYPIAGSAAMSSITGMTRNVKDPIDNICSSSVELNRKSISLHSQFGEQRISDRLSVHRDGWIEEDFFGLPLNSHGELIQMHSSGKAGFDHLLKKQNTTACVGTSPLYYNLMGPKNIMNYSNMNDKFQVGTTFSNLRWLSEQNYLKDNPAKAPLSSMQGFTEMHTNGTEALVFDTIRGINHSPHHLNSNLSPMNISCHGCGEYGQTHCHACREMVHGNSDCMFPPTAPPTMRLMGKNLTLGKSNIEGHGFKDGKVWTDKEIINKHCHAITVSASSAPKSCFEQEWVHPASRASKENMIHSAEAQINPRPSSFVQMTASQQPKFAHTQLSSRTHLMSFHGLPLIGGSDGADSFPFKQPLPPQALLNKASISGTDSFKMSHQMPLQVRNPHNSHLQNMMLSSTQYRDSNSVAYNTQLDFQPHFPNQCTEVYLQPSWAQCSSLWPRNAAQQNETFFPSRPFNLPAKQHPCMAAANHLRLPSPYVSPFISLPDHTSDPSHPCLQNSTIQNSLVHCSSLLSANPEFRPSFTVNATCRNMCQTSKSSSLNDPNVTNKTKKRPAFNTNEYSIPVKKPNIEVQDLNVPSGSKRTNMHGDTLHNAGTSELHIYKDRSADLGVSGIEIGKNQSGIVSEVNASKLDNGARSGPLKLTAGAKHILKPSQDTDRDNCRPTHSTIPFAAVADSGKISEFQKNTAKIYRF